MYNVNENGSLLRRRPVSSPDVARRLHGVSVQHHAIHYLNWRTDHGPIVNRYIFGDYYNTQHNDQTQ